MKQLLRFKKILLGFWFFLFVVFISVTGYLIVTHSLDDFDVATEIIATFIICSGCVLIIILIFGLKIFKAREREYIKKLYKITLRDCEPKVSLEYMKDDLTMHAYLEKGNIEDSILRNAFFLFCYGEFEKSQILVMHINEKFKNHLENNRNSKLTLLKLECLLASMKEDKDEFNLKYHELEQEIEISPENSAYPSEKLGRIIEIINNIINDCQMNKILTGEYLKNIKFFSRFEKYTVIAFLIYNDILIADNLKDEFKNRMNSLYEKMLK